MTCILTFVIMFLPRSRQLTAMGKEGLYLEDHEDQVSLHRHDQEEGNLVNIFVTYQFPLVLQKVPSEGS